MRQRVHLPYNRIKGAYSLLSYVLPFCLLMTLNPNFSFSKSFEKENYSLDLERNESISNISEIEMSAILMDIVPADTTICAGQTIQFAVSGIDPNTSLEWSATAGSFNDINSLTPVYTNFSSGTYSIVVILTDQNNNNIGTLNTSITIAPPISVSISTTGQTCTQLGGIDLTTSGGSGNYMFDWADIPGVDDGEDRDNLTAGNYSIDITDDLGCIQSLIISVPQLCSNTCTANAGTITPNATFLCVPGSTATIEATPDGNSIVPAGYVTAYFLTTGANSLIEQVNGAPSFIVTTSNTYTIHTFVYDPSTFDINTVIPNTTTAQEVNAQLIQGGGSLCGSLDLNGATTLAEKAIGFVITSTPENCDAENGQVELAPPGNSFLWPDGFLGNSRTDLADGTYVVTVTQNTSCTDELTIIVDEVCDCQTPPTIDFILVFESSCGNASGSATIEMVGDNNGYTYEWEPNVSNSNVGNNLSAGSYTVTITDTNDLTCFSIESFTIGNADGPSAQITSSTPANCTSLNGGAILSPSNLDYLWCDGGTGSTRNDLPAGTCFVTVTDPSTGCFNIIEVEIAEVNNLVGQVNIGSQPSCNAMDGVATILVSGGSGDYSFLWNDGGASATRFGLAAGVYDVLITDNNDGCTTLVSFSLTNSVASAAVNIASNISLDCAGDDNGFVSYNIQPSTSFVQPATEVIRNANGQIFTNGNLSAGEYCVLVFDGNNCLAGQGCFEVTEPDNLILDLSSTNETCSQLGSISINVSGGFNGYTYDWGDLVGSNDPANRSGLIAGNYSLTVTDGNGCTAITSIDIQDDCNGSSCDADAGNLTIDANPVCLDQGSATISATLQGNQVVPAGYSIAYVLTSFGVIQATSTTPSFTVNATDSYVIHTLVYDPNTLDLSIVVPNVTLAQQVNDLLIQGGGTICASLDLNGAPVQVINCSSPCTDPVIIDITTTEADCNQSNGSASVNVLGNNNNYTYSFSDGNANLNTVTGLTSGNYTVTITDNTNASCFVVGDFIITNINGPQATVISTSPTSCSANNGAAELAPVTFEYTWCDGGTGAIRNDLASGICPVTVTDPTTGCTNIIEVEIQADNILQIDPIINQNPDCGSANGGVTIQVSGGSNNYTFEWSDPNSVNSSTRNDLEGGTYTVTVTDNGPSGCIGTTTFTLTENTLGTATITITSISQPDCPGDQNGAVSYTFITGGGFVPNANERIVDGSGNVVSPLALTAGDYCIEIIDGNGCIAGSECFTISDPDPIVIDPSVVPTSCTQGGSITLTVTGGSGSYSYNWADIGGNNDPQNRIDLAVGTYSVTVTDGLGCTTSLDDIIVDDGCVSCQATAGTLQADSTNICFTGSPLTISATEITPPTVPTGFTFIYVLTSGAGLDVAQVNAIPEFSVNALGNYTIHTLVFDPNTLNPSNYSNGIDLNADLIQGGGTICGALDVAGAVISLIDCGGCIPPQVQNSTIISATCGNADGAVTLNVAGTGTYNYAWSSGGSTTNSITGLVAGSYTYTITDANNPTCFTIDSLVVGNSDGPQVNIFSSTPASCNANTGTAVLEPQTNNEFVWSDGGIGAIRPDLAPGVNFVTVTDIITNCTNVIEVFIESASLLNIQVDIINTPDCQVANGEVGLTITGGSTNYTYIWSDNPNIDAPNRNNLAGGVYSVTVIDNGPNQCIDSLTFTLLENVAGADITINNLNNEVLVSCSGETDGEVLYDVVLSAGFSGNPTETIFDALGNEATNGQLSPGDYCIVVTDGNGCFAGQGCFEVLDAGPIEIIVQVTDATCNDPGGITTFGFGGSGFLLYDWEDLPSTSDPQNRFNLEPGLYSLTVTDQSGCTAVVNDILVEDDCQSDCPTSEEVNLILPINTVDSFCVSLDSCFIDSLTTYQLLGGGNAGSSIYGSGTLKDICVVYTANDTAGIFVDTICVLANYNILTDTTCIIVTVLPQCGGIDIIQEDSITLVTDNCVDGADFCLEIELAQILNFNLTDNGQPFNIGNQGCNFDTTFFYSLAAFLNIAPDGPYSLTSWNVNGSMFTIDSFNMISQLVDSMNIWDPTGNWILDGSVITGGAPGATYGSLNLIQINSGASTNLDVDLNQIPNGTLLTLDTGFHELIITDLVTGCLDTLYANVICDDCPDYYSGSSTVVGIDCNAPTDLCLDIPFQEFIFNFEIIDNGAPYTDIRKGCGFDTLSTCYLVSALPDQGTAGPYSVDTWAVGGVTFASNFNDLQELLNLMNGWDPTGNWILDTNGTICGGTPGQSYGAMEITQINTGAIAVLEPDFVILTFASAIELDTGFHQIILIDTVAGCTDTIEVFIDCDVVTGGIDTILTVQVSDTDTFCFNLTDTIVNATNLCPDFSDGNVAGFGFIPNTNCIEYSGVVIGLDTFCMVFEYSDGTIDTAGIVIEVVPQLFVGDTIPIEVLINSVETFCIDTSAFLAPLDTIYNYCESSSGSFSDVEIIDPNCIEVAAFDIGGLDTACIVICDTTGFCDTTVFLIDVIPPMTTTVFDTVDIDQSYTFCPDTTELIGNLFLIENICESSSGTSVDFTVDPNTFCVDFDAIALGTDSACIVICDEFAVCDTTIYIVTVTYPADTILAVDDDTSTVTINPVTIDIFANDIFNPDSLVFGIISGVSNGTLVSNPDGSFTYLAEAGYCGGVDSFTYFISNGTQSDTATVTIEVLCDDLFIFNGFSPNNDGVNETLVIQGIDNFSENIVRIYNRWGNLVYQKEGYSNDDGWDGRFEDKDLPDGTYFYIINDGEGNRYTGWIQLLR